MGNLRLLVIYKFNDMVFIGILHWRYTLIIGVYRWRHDFSWKHFMECNFLLEMSISEPDVKLKFEHN